MVDFADLISKPFTGFKINPVDAKPLTNSQDEYALAKEGLQKIFDQGLEALADDQIQREFLTYSATLLSSDICPSELKADLSSFRGDLPKETSCFIQAKNELKVASHLMSSISLKKFVLQQEYSKYTNAKKELLASAEKIANLKTSLAKEERKKLQIDELLDSIDLQLTSAKDELILELAQVSDMEETVQAAKQLVSQRQLVWNSLRKTFTKFAWFVFCFCLHNWVGIMI